MFKSVKVGFKDKKGKLIRNNDNVIVSLPIVFEKDRRARYKGKIAFKEGEFRVVDLRNIETSKPFRVYEPDNYVRLKDLRVIIKMKPINNYIEVPIYRDKEVLDYLEVVSFSTPPQVRSRELPC
ncbi:MAG: hypothetical protein ACOCQR_03535 [bacterium]